MQSLATPLVIVILKQLNVTTGIGLCVDQEQQDCLRKSSAQHNQQDRETKPQAF